MSRYQTEESITHVAITWECGWINVYINGQPIKVIDTLEHPEGTIEYNHA